MQFMTMGRKGAPAVLLIHGMLSSGDDPLTFGKYLADGYYVISPTLDGHGDDGSELVSAQQEAQNITAYLKDEQITSLALIQGSSMGAEVALAVADECRRKGISVGRCFFDGGPFFDFSPVKRCFMKHVFRHLIKAFEGDPDKVFDKLNRNMFVKFVARDKLRDYGPLLRSIAGKRRTFTDSTVDGMVETCYHCKLPVFTHEEQRSFVFFFSLDEPARQSKSRLKKAYPNAVYRDVRGYAHCSLQFTRPKTYAKLLRQVMENKEI